MDKHIIVAITGASGAVYAQRLIDCLLAADVHVHLVISPNGRRLLHDELEVTDVSAEQLVGRAAPLLALHAYKDVGSRLASGSSPTQGMVVIPATGNIIGAIASGLGDNLITRAAAVTLKERRRLILVPREMPFSHIELENLLRLSSAGAIICPACPGFYLKPQGIGDLVDFVVGRVMDLLAIAHHLDIRWEPA